MGVLDTHEYLGITFNWKGRVAPRQTKELDDMLRELKEVPLKPYQRLEILRSFLVPKLLHRLVLGGAHRNTLRTMDRAIRTAVRSWLRLPKDTPIAYLHAPIASGGINIPNLSTSIPLLQILNSGRKIHKAIQSLPSFQRILTAVNRQYKVGDEVVTNASFDGRDLTAVDIDQGSHLWVKNPDRVFPRLHLRGLQLRGGLLAMKGRMSRGRSRLPSELACRGACNNTETLNHILQVCAVTHNGRCARHNRILRRLQVIVSKTGAETSLEPIIPTARSFIKPDLVVPTGENITIMDVAVVAGQRMEESWRMKIAKYGSPENELAIRDWIGGSSTIKHLPVIISWRGLMYESSGRGLRKMGLTTRDISDLCLLADNVMIST